MKNKNCKICLHSMVGNEENVIERMLESCYKYVDYWVIQCNGSDKTRQIIENFFQEKQIPGFTYDYHWTNDYGVNRDHAIKTLLNSEHGCDWIIRMDADEQLYVDDDFDWDILNDTSIQTYNIAADQPGAIYYRNRVWNAKFSWSFGTTGNDKRHENIYLDGKQDFQICNLPPSIKHILTNDGITWNNPNKYLNDALELERTLLMNGTLLSDNYHFFYVGKSYNDCYGNKDLPLGYSHQKEYARRCIFYFEEFIRNYPYGEMAYYAQYLVGNAYRFCKEYSNAVKAYLDSEKYCQERNEHFQGLAETYMEIGDYGGMLIYTSKLMSPERKNPFPKCQFLIHKHSYYDTENYVQYLHSIALEKTNNV